MNALRIRTVAWVAWLEVLRRKDVYVLLILLGMALVVLVSLNVFGLGGVVRYVADIGLLMAWFFGWLLAVMVGARQLAQEETRGTALPLLAKPVTRGEVIVGKWLGAWSVVCVATMVFYALVALVVAGKGGHVRLAIWLQGFMLHCAALGVITAIGLAFSTRLNLDAAATLAFILSAASFVIVPRVPEFLAREGGLTAGLLMFLYNLLPHFEVFDMRIGIVHDFPCVRALWMLTSLGYGAVLTILFLFIAWLAYRGKRFSRAKQG